MGFTFTSSTPDFSSHLNLNNLPSELIHLIQDKVCDIGAVDGLKAIVRLSAVNKNMRQHVISDKKLFQIDARRELLATNDLEYVFKIANFDRRFIFNSQLKLAEKVHWRTLDTATCRLIREFERSDVLHQRDFLLGCIKSQNKKLSHSAESQFIKDVQKWVCTSRGCFITFSTL